MALSPSGFDQEQMDKRLAEMEDEKKAALVERDGEWEQRIIAIDQEWTQKLNQKVRSISMHLSITMRVPDVPMLKCCLSKQ